MVLSLHSRSYVSSGPAYSGLFILFHAEVKVHRFFWVVSRHLSVKVAACAICGTDLRIYRHGHSKVRFPAVIGHEIVGRIEAAEYVMVPEKGALTNIFSIPDGTELTDYALAASV